MSTVIRVWLVALTMVAASVLTTGTAAAAPTKPKPLGVQECNENYATYGFTSEGECKRHVAQGGTLSTARLTITEYELNCTGTYACYRITGSGLAPSSPISIHFDQVLSDGTPRTGDWVIAFADADGNYTSGTVLADCAGTGSITNFYFYGTDPDGNLVKSNVVDPCPAAT